MIAWRECVPQSRINQRRMQALMQHIKAVAVYVRPGKSRQLLSRGFSVASRAIRPTHRRIINTPPRCGIRAFLSFAWTASRSRRRRVSNWKRINLIAQFPKLREIDPAIGVASASRRSVRVYPARISFIVHCAPETIRWQSFGREWRLL